MTATYVGPATDAGGKPPTQPPADPDPQEIAVDADTGAFSDAYQLAPGVWDLTISATGAAAKTTTEQRHVTVAYTGVALVIRVKDARAWLKVWVDDQLVQAEGERVIQPGKSVVTGQNSIRSDGQLWRDLFHLNGTRLGSSANPVSRRRGCCCQGAGEDRTHELSATSAVEDHQPREVIMVEPRVRPSLPPNPAPEASSATC